MHQTQLFTDEEQKLRPNNQYTALVYFIAHLDIELVSLFLEDNRTYQDFPKYLFVSKLIKAFEQFEMAGDRVLKLYKGRCAGCNRGCRGFTFLGKEGHYMDLLFIVEDNKVNDIYECPRFINDEIVIGKRIQVEISPTNDSQFNTE